MGSTFAQDLSELCTLDIGLEQHLRYNHYPPLPVSLIPACKAAIEACQDEDYHAEIELPKGVTYRGHTSAPASVCVEAWHLDAWINSN